MKNLVYAFGLIILLSAFHSTDYKTSFSWMKTSHDFGQIEQGKPVTATFEFLNKGDENIEIASTKASCGCTVADFSRGSIAPGEKGFVKATYNAAKAGQFKKSVTVQPTAGEPIVLYIKGEVTN